MLGKKLTALGIDGITMDNERKCSPKEGCMQKRLIKHFNSLGHSHFLPTTRTLKRERTTGGEL